MWRRCSYWAKNAPEGYKVKNRKHRAHFVSVFGCGGAISVWVRPPHLQFLYDADDFWEKSLLSRLAIGGWVAPRRNCSYCLFVPYWSNGGNHRIKRWGNSIQRGDQRDFSQFFHLTPELVSKHYARTFARYTAWSKVLTGGIGQQILWSFGFANRTSLGIWLVGDSTRRWRYCW